MWKNRIVGSIVAVSLGGATALATNLDVSVNCDGNNTVTTAPGCTVNYTVNGQLDDLINEGLALVGFNLEFVMPDGSPNPPQAVALAPGNSPTTAPMSNFVKNLGLTNPDGYGGTVDNGRLVQCGGGQNTIMNAQVVCTGPMDCPTGSTCQGALCTAVAPFPIGTVMTGVAKGVSEVLLTGTVDLPTTLPPGTYELRLTTLIANAIQTGQVGNPFWVTQEVFPGVVTNLQVVVQGVAGDACAFCGPAIVASDPPINAIDAGQPHPRTDATILQGWTSVDVTFSSTPLAAPAMTDFFVSSVDNTGTPGTPPSISAVSPLVGGNTVTITFGGPIEPGNWTVITHNPSGSKTCLGFLPGDVNGSRGSNAQDITSLINSLNNVVPRPDYATDVNRSGPPSNAQDITSEINLLNGAGMFTPWNSASLASSSPCD